MDPMKARSDIGQGKKNVLLNIHCYINVNSCYVLFYLLSTLRKLTILEMVLFYDIQGSVYCKQVNKLFFWRVERINLFYIIYNGKI